MTLLFLTIIIIYQIYYLTLSPALVSISQTINYHQYQSDFSNLYQIYYAKSSTKNHKCHSTLLPFSHLPTSATNVAITQKMNLLTMANLTIRNVYSGILMEEIFLLYEPSWLTTVSHQIHDLMLIITISNSCYLAHQTTHCYCALMDLSSLKAMS
jgi:hypothetical protein